MTDARPRALPAAEERDLALEALPPLMRADAGVWVMAREGCRELRRTACITGERLLVGLRVVVTRSGRTWSKERVQRSVDQKAELFSAHRPLLLSIAYRMLGSMAEAEDIVQDAYIRWQQTTTRVRTPRAFLVTTVSRLCINHLKSARVRREEYVGAWLPEPVSDAALSTGPPAGDDSLSIAFLLLLERLTPVERAVFLLREVFEYEYEEIAGILKQSEVACRQILRRARQHIAENRPRFAPSREQRADLLRRFLDASSRGDLDGLVALLHKDVVLYADSGGKATAIPRPICGPEHVARFILRAPRKLLPTGLVRQFGEVNGQPAIVSYRDGRPHSVFTIEIAAGAIRNVFIMANPDKLNSVRTVCDPLSQNLASPGLEIKE